MRWGLIGMLAAAVLALGWVVLVAANTIGELRRWGLEQRSRIEHNAPRGSVAVGDDW